MGRARLRRCSTRSASGARSPAFFGHGRRGSAALAAGERPRRARHPRRASTTSAARQNKRWDLTAAGAVHPVGPDAGRSCRASTRRSHDPRLRPRAGIPAVPRPPRRVPVPLEAGRRSSTSTRTRSRPLAQPVPGRRRYGTVVFEYEGRTERVTSRRRAGPDQRAHQGGHRASSTRSTSSRGTARRDTAATERERLQRASSTRSDATTTRSTSSCSRSRGVPADAAVRGRRRAEDRLPAGRDRRAAGVPREGRQAVPDARSAGTTAIAPTPAGPHRALRRTGASTSATTSSST